MKKRAGVVTFYLKLLGENVFMCVTWPAQFSVLCLLFFILELV